LPVDEALLCSLKEEMRFQALLSLAQLVCYREEPASCFWMSALLPLHPALEPTALRGVRGFSLRFSVTVNKGKAGILLKGIAGRGEGSLAISSQL
jgi:hypothetical protein